MSDTKTSIITKMLNSTNAKLQEAGLDQDEIDTRSAAAIKRLKIGAVITAVVAASAIAVKVYTSKPVNDEIENEDQ